MERAVFEKSVKDLLFENVWKEEFSRMVRAEVRAIRRAKTPDLHEKLKELRKKLQEARNKGKFDEIGKLTVEIEKVEKLIAEKTPKETAALDNLRKKIAELKRERRQYFKMIIPKALVVETAKAAAGQPEFVSKIVDEIFERAAGGEGAKGAR